jgi:hypothetical protein
MTWSTVASPRRRHANRSQALANLEGRSHPARLARTGTRSSKRRNFMSMSDDEADDEHDQIDVDVADDDQVQMPPLSRIFTPEVSLTFPVTPDYMPHGQTASKWPTKTRSRQVRRATDAQKLPLTLPNSLSFMDLNADVDEDAASFVLDFGAWLSDDASITDL